MRAADSKALIGELDEEFVWERSLGDTFVFGAQGWRIQKIDHQNVEVVPVAARIGHVSVLEGGGEKQGLPHLASASQRRWRNGTRASTTSGCSAELEDISRSVRQRPRAQCSGFLSRQREATGTDLPHRHHLLVEHTRDPDGKGEGASVVLHTLWGGRVNRPFGLALSAAWEERFGYRPEMIQTNDAILLLLPQSTSAR